MGLPFLPLVDVERVQRTPYCRQICDEQLPVDSLHIEGEEPISLYDLLQIKFQCDIRIFKQSELHVIYLSNNDSKRIRRSDKVRIATRNHRLAEKYMPQSIWSDGAKVGMKT